MRENRNGKEELEKKVSRIGVPKKELKMFFTPKLKMPNLDVMNKFPLQYIFQCSKFLYNSQKNMLLYIKVSIM